MMGYLNDGTVFRSRCFRCWEYEDDLELIGTDLICGHCRTDMGIGHSGDPETEDEE